MFEISKNPSLTLRVSFDFPTLLSWSTEAEREKRNIKTNAMGTGILERQVARFRTV